MENIKQISVSIFLHFVCQVGRRGERGRWWFNQASDTTLQSFIIIQGISPERCSSNTCPINCKLKISPSLKLKASSREFKWNVSLCAQRRFFMSENSRKLSTSLARRKLRHCLREGVNDARTSTAEDGKLWKFKCFRNFISVDRMRKQRILAFIAIYKRETRYIKIFQK